MCIRFGHKLKLKPNKPNYCQIIALSDQDSYSKFQNGGSDLIGMTGTFIPNRETEPGYYSGAFMFDLPVYEEIRYAYFYAVKVKRI